LSKKSQTINDIVFRKKVGEEEILT